MKIFNFPLIHRKISFLSDVNIKKRMNLMLMFAILPIIILCLTTLIISSSVSKNYQKDSEDRIITSAEQYINASIENVISVAKTVYTNNVIYEFLNTDYKNQIEYYDAFYKLTENNALTMAENNNISQFTIYTANETIMSGGSIARLSDSIRAENWYTEFANSSKSMIIYCDAESCNLSLIRKLDYYNIDKGECLLKIDFSRTSVQQCLKNLNFDGKLLVMSNGVLLYSNLEKATDEDRIISTDFSCFTKNYYSADLEYYAKAEKISIIKLLKNNLAVEIICIVLLLISISCLFILINNVFKRIYTVDKCIKENKSFLSLTGQTVGNDEVGQIYDNFVDMSKSLDKNKNDYKQCIAMLDKCHEDNYNLLMHALEADTALTYIKIYGKDSMKNIVSTDVEKSYKIPLRKEFDMISNLPEKENIKIIIPDKNTIPENLLIRPVLLWNIVRSISKYVSEHNPDTPVSININLEHDDSSFTVSITHNGTVSSKYILKLKAIFEDMPSSSDFKFRPQYDYNPYIHLKKYYGRLLNASVSSDNGFSLVLKFKN